MNNTKLGVGGGAVLIGALLFGSCVPSGREPIPITGNTMGTTFSVTLISPPRESVPEALASDIQEVLDEVNRSMSTYESDSELSRFNRTTGEWFEVSTDLWSVLAASIEVSEKTEGAFDVTVAPLVRLWGFGAGAEDDPRPPSSADLEEVTGGIGFRLLELREDPRAARKEVPSLELDLSGIAKGFAVDRVAALLEAHGFSDYLVEVGGEVRTSGTNPSGELWRIGIEAPIAGSRGLQRTVGLSGQSMATSGDYRNFYVSDGNRLSHLIDPRTAAPVAHETASVSVVDPSCMRADALASGLLVLGAEEGYALAVAEDLAVLFLVRDAAGNIEERATPAFERLLQNVSTMGS